ncbi:unnamed protein product [Phytophthora lilii]|uniref:Unnamed protein product n=1 Tax=Phytophthora lilii TaxID=2077276 RepID=A0A9W6WN52_9STRA|nr:unnamed protein product [Phytophthora lilii]
MLQRAAESYRWLQEQQSAIVPSELGVFQFLVLCFEQVGVAGAVINCFQAKDFDGGDAPLSLPVVMDHVPQVLMVIAVMSVLIVWGTRLVQWSLRSALLNCTCAMKFTTRRRLQHGVIFPQPERNAAADSTVPSMAWASWTCCQRGSTPERVSYQLHRYVTVMTIVMGMSVVEVSPTLNNDIAGAVVFLVADIVLTGLRLYEGRHRRRERRRVARARRLTMTPTNGDNSTPSSDLFPSPCEPSARSGHRNRDIEAVTPHVCREVPQHIQSHRLDSTLKQCLDLKRLGVWKKTVIQDLPTKEWVFALLDCANSVLVVLNFYETIDAAGFQVMHELFKQNGRASRIDQVNLMENVDKTVLYLAVGFSTVLGVSLLARWYVLYSSKHLGEETWAASSAATATPNYFAVGVVAVKVALLPFSIYVFAVAFVDNNLYVRKRGVNALVAHLICAMAAARTVDSLGRAFQGLGRSAVGLPGADAVQGSRYERASIALQVFWDRLNDFLAPLGIVHLLVSTTEVGKNFVVVYLLLMVCVLHAMIAYVDAVDIPNATYLAERLGYLVAVTFLVRNSAKYVERRGMDLFAPVLLVAMEFMQLVVALSSLWRDKFHKFYDQLVLREKDFRADFPPKGTLFFTPKPEERQEQLEAFLQQVLAFYAARGYPAEVEDLLCELLKVPRHLRSPEHEDDDVSTSTESVLDEPMHEPPSSADSVDVQKEASKLAEETQSPEKEAAENAAPEVAEQAPVQEAEVEEKPVVAAKPEQPASSVAEEPRPVEEVETAITQENEEAAVETPVEAAAETPASAEEADEVKQEVKKDVKKQVEEELASIEEDADEEAEPVSSEVPVEEAAAETAAEEAVKEEAVVEPPAQEPEVVTPEQQPVVEAIAQEEKPAPPAPQTAEKLAAPAPKDEEQKELAAGGRVSSWLAAYLPKSLLGFIRRRCMKRTSLVVLCVALLLPMVLARR